MKRDLRILLLPTLLSLIFIACGPSQQEIQQEIEREKREREKAQELVRLENLRVDSLGFYNSLSDSVFQINQITKSVAYLDSALLYANANEEDTLIVKRASRLFAIRKYELALKDYTYLITATQDLVGNYYQRALCFEKLKQRQEAVSDLRKSIDLGNENALVLYERINPERRKISHYVTRCCDGSTSSAKGRGACSHHGGVCNWNDAIYVTYRKY